MAAASPAPAAPYPEPREASWVARDFRFHTGEVMPELRLGYLTLGDPSGISCLCASDGRERWTCVLKMLAQMASTSPS